MVGARPKLLWEVDLHKRIIAALKLGPLSVMQLVKRVGMTYSTIQRILASHPDQFEIKVERTAGREGAKWGLKN
jgi:hypothetical protein